MPTVPHTARRNRALCALCPQEDAQSRSHTGSSGEGQGALAAQQHTRPSHLVLLPELVQHVAVDGVLDEADIEALYAKVEVPKPEDEAVGWEGSGLPGPGPPEADSKATALALTAPRDNFPALRMQDPISTPC